MKKLTPITKGLMLWIFNNVLLIVVVDSVFIFLKEPALETILRFVFFGMLWVITGSMIVGSFVDAREFYNLIRKEETNYENEKK